MEDSEGLTGGIVRATAGGEKGALFCVIKDEGRFLQLVDGKRRKVEKPKRKARKHIAYLGASHHPALLRLRAGQAVLDSELRRALAVFRAELEEGMTLGKG